MILPSSVVSGDGVRHIPQAWVVSRLNILWSRQFPTKGKLPIYSTRVYLGHFMADTPKLIQLYSTRPDIDTISRYKFRKWLPDSCGVCTYGEVGRSGQAKVRGSSGLKETQAYPSQFGFAIARLYKRVVRDLRVAAAIAQVEDSSGHDFEDLWSQACDPWADALLVGPCQILRDLAVCRGVCG